MRLIYKLFIAEVSKQKKLQKLTNKDIAKKAGLTLSTVDAFMCGSRGTERTANAIARALGIER